MGTDSDGLPTDTLRAEDGSYHVVGSLTVTPPPRLRKKSWRGALAWHMLSKVQERSLSLQYLAMSTESAVTIWSTLKILRTRNWTRRLSWTGGSKKNHAKLGNWTWPLFWDHWSHHAGWSVRSWPEGMGNQHGSSAVEKGRPRPSHDRGLSWHRPCYTRLAMSKPRYFPNSLFRFLAFVNKKNETLLFFCIFLHYLYRRGSFYFRNQNS